MRTRRRPALLRPALPHSALRLREHLHAMHLQALRRPGPVFAAVFVAGGLAVGIGAAAGATSVSPADADAAAAARSAVGSDRWQPGRRTGGELPDGGNCTLLQQCKNPTALPQTGDRDDLGGPGRTGASTEYAEGGEGGDGTATGVTASGTPGVPAWTPATPLPSAGTPGRRVDVVLSPHPDDETLSLGVWIADAVARGDRVVVVALTDGRSTGAINSVSTRLGRQMTRDDIAAARIREMQQATSLLGVAPGDLYQAHLDAEKTPGGSRVTLDEARAVIDAFSQQFPEATFATMSWVAERHPDHLNAGHALREALAAGRVKADFAISRLWWTLASPAATDVLPTSAAARNRVIQAAHAYELWDPTRQRYSIGWLSVRAQFTELINDPRNRIHGLGPLVPAPIVQP